MIRRLPCFIPTFEGLVKLIFPKDDPQVVYSTGVKLHPEYHISTRTTVALVVALELEVKRKFKTTVQVMNQKLFFLKYIYAYYLFINAINVSWNKKAK